MCAEEMRNAPLADEADIVKKGQGYRQGLLRRDVAMRTTVDWILHGPLFGTTH